MALASLPGISEPSVPRIFAVLGACAAMPILMLLTGVPSRIALPILAILAITGTLYGAYWTMRIVHIDRASARR